MPIPDRVLTTWLHAFIGIPDAPDEHFQRGASGAWLLKAPRLPTVWDLAPTGCFTIDGRGFSISPNVSARMTFEAQFVISARSMRIERVAGRQMGRIGETRNVDCANERMLKEPRRSSADTVAVGAIKTSPDGWKHAVNVKGSAANPFYELSGVNCAGRIDFELVLTFDARKQWFDVRGTTGTFPSFEMYYKINGGEPEAIIRWAPASGAGPLSLYDLNLGLNARSFEKTIQLPLS